MQMAAPVYYSADMARALPDDGNRYEVVYGELLVTPVPSPWHQELVGRTLCGLHDYLKGHAGGHVILSPSDISPRSDVLVQPDVFVVPEEEARTWDWTQVRTLLLVLEVVSPATVRPDRFTKRRFYQQAGVPVYWAIDPDQEAVEVWSPDAQFPTIERESISWHPHGVPEPFVLNLRELFHRGFP